MGFLPINSPDKKQAQKTSLKRLVSQGFLVGTRGFEPPPPIIAGKIRGHVDKDIVETLY